MSIQVTPADKGSSPKITTSHNELSEIDIRETFESLEPVEIDLNLGEITEEGEETRKKQDILFDGYISLNADGIDLNGISSFKQTINSSWNTVRHIAWYDLIIHQHKYESKMSILRNHGYIVTYFEDLKKLDDMPNYTVVITSITQVQNILS